MKNKKVILSSILSLVLCLSLIVGGTFALFTSETKTNIAINSGKVEVVSEVTGLTLYSHENIDVNTKVGTKIDVTGNTFPNGGTANYANGTLTLDRLTPGDGVNFNIFVTNNSNVAIKYRTVISDPSGSSLLMNGLAVTINGAEYYGAVTGEWTSLEAEGTIAAIPVSIELPTTAGNDYQGLDVSIAISVEAIQGNAVDNVASINGTAYETFADAIAAAQSGDVVEVAENAIIQMPANVADGVTVKGATFNTPVNVTAAAATVAEGDEPVEATADPVIFDSCTFRGNALVSVADRDVKLTNCTFIDTAAGANVEGNMPYIYQKSGEATVTVESSTADVTIRSAEKWVEMAKALNTLDDQSYLTLKVGANLDFTGIADYTVNNLATTLDGQGYTISNLKDAALFNTISGEVKNLNLKGVTGATTESTGNSTYNFASFANTVSGKVTDCSVSDVKVNINYITANHGGSVYGAIGTVAEGGIVDGLKVSNVTIEYASTCTDCSDGDAGVIGGVSEGGTVKNGVFTNINLIAQGKLKRTGGIFGSVAGTVSKCTVNGVNIIMTGNNGYTDQVGGFVGGIGATANISDCILNDVTITADDDFYKTGGFAGITYGGTIKNCDMNNVTMVAKNHSEFGGFIGHHDSRSDTGRITVENCDVKGLDMTIKGKYSSWSCSAAGFISGVSGGADIKNCTVAGKIDAKEATVTVGGFVGSAGSSQNYTINLTNCVADVDITVGNNIGGAFAGRVGGCHGTGNTWNVKFNFTNCEANGTVTATGTGTAGNFYGEKVVETCTFTNCKVDGADFAG